MLFSSLSYFFAKNTYLVKFKSLSGISLINKFIIMLIELITKHINHCVGYRPPLINKN